MQNFCEEKINECIAAFEKEVMQILSDTSLDKYRKNLLIKPLSTKKQILTNAIESMRLVDAQTKDS
jgi:hypothetical protein